MKNKTIKLTLTEEEWCELANALSSKALQVEEGRYGEEENPGDDAKWAATLWSAYEKVTPVLDKEGVVY